MIESIYLWFMSAGLILLILGIELERITYNSISILMWIMVLASNIFIEIPSISDSYDEPSLMIISFGMIIINAISIIYQYTQNVTDTRTDRIVHRYR